MTELWHDILYWLAVYRVTVLLWRDGIAAPFRSLARRNRWTWQLVQCPWCLSVWVAAALWPMAWLNTPWVWWVFLAASASAVTGFLAERS